MEDAIYSLVSELETVLLCTTECGQNPNEIFVCDYFYLLAHLFPFLTLLLPSPFQSEKISVGASLNIVENLKTITLGGLTFLLPDDLSELQEELGGEGKCVYTGYSLINREGSS